MSMNRSNSNLLLCHGAASASDDGMVNEGASDDGMLNEGASDDAFLNQVLDGALN